MKEERNRYLTVYDFYKNLIINGQMAAEQKMPSIRKGAEQMQVSRTTMESAYMLLAAEGYIISKPQSGYYVTEMATKQKESVSQKLSVREQKLPVRFDFVSSSVDQESFKFDLWRRYIKSALRQDERLLSYGEPQGELEFREVLAEYLRDTRGVVCLPEQIVIGAGVQSLLHILCPMIKERKDVSFHNPDFIQGRAIFLDYEFQVSDGEAKQGGIYYISTARTLKNGGILSTRERLDLIQKAAEMGQLIIEDDYNSEFQYAQRVIPSIQGLAGGKGVVYLGTFSKMLLPSIRMSFMVLPPELVERYELRKERYNQTASKVEQIAITQYIRDGHLMSQIRKSRKIQGAKAERFVHTAKRIFGKETFVRMAESGFYVILEQQSEYSAGELERRALEIGIKVKVLPKDKKEERAKLILECSNVKIEDYEEALELLKKIF